MWRRSKIGSPSRRTRAIRSAMIRASTISSFLCALIKHCEEVVKVAEVLQRTCDKTFAYLHRRG
jgi:hypothetical protein